MSAGQISISETRTRKIRNFFAFDANKCRVNVCASHPERNLFLEIFFDGLLSVSTMSKTIYFSLGTENEGQSPLYEVKTKILVDRRDVHWPEGELSTSQSATE